MTCCNALYKFLPYLIYPYFQYLSKCHSFHPGRPLLQELSFVLIANLFSYITCMEYLSLNIKQSINQLSSFCRSFLDHNIDFDYFIISVLVTRHDTNLQRYWQFIIMNAFRISFRKKHNLITPFSLKDDMENSSIHGKNIFQMPPKFASWYMIVNRLK